MIAVIFDMDGVIINYEPIHAQVKQLVLSQIEAKSKFQFSKKIYEYILLCILG